MSSLPQSVPASFRGSKPLSRIAANLLSDRRSAQLIQPTLETRPSDNRTSEARAPIAINSALVRGRMTRLPHEPEDARITGVTRSLHRRLLALNIGGSLAIQS